MSPAVASTPAVPTTPQAVKPAEPVVLTVPAAADAGSQPTCTQTTHRDHSPVVSKTVAKTIATTMATTAPMPRLHEGKRIPGPDEWRTLERRALSFRLRGRDGAIGS
jgi:hypothetical protein